MLNIEYPNVAAHAPRRVARTSGRAGRSGRSRDPAAPKTGGAAGAAAAGSDAGGLRERERGAVLLEVVLALLLFVGAAAVISGGLHAALTSVERMRLSMHAANLAISLVAELQLGIRGTEMQGPAPFDPPFEDWTWEMVAARQEFSVDSTGPEWTRVEVIIRHEDPPLTHRLAQLVQPGVADCCGTEDAQSGDAAALDETVF
ncbi:MAG: hypothetical protein JXQ71_17150 [Verrucomicrobia bacterium]|nr:hypothetical protein [Verrucomicrobiota bacterium]